MSLVTLNHVTKYYDPVLILDDISWQISDGDRIGLIGANGTGKTTLLEIIAGVQKDFMGKVSKARWVRIGYLSQEPDLVEDCHLRDEMLKIFKEQHDLEAQMEAVAEQMGHPDADTDLLLERYARLQEKHEAAGGYDYEHRINMILGGLGFDSSYYDMPIEVFSGGEKSRAALAKLLLEEPNLLLLDEATNHLDIEAIEWLESFLNNEYRGAVVVVSHDRYFLDKVAKKIAELKNHRLTVYRGNYSTYLKTKEIETLTQERKYKQQQKLIAHNEEFIRRYMAGQRSREAKGRQKLLDRMERVEKPKERKTMSKLQFTPDVRGGDDILRLRDVSKSYGNKKIFENLTFDIYRKDVVGIIGPNGAGKTTLFRMILSEEQPTSGEFWVGHNLKFGYYDQEHASLNPNNTLIDEISELRPDWLPEDVRTFLGHFLFSGDDVFKLISELSGGEQSRIMLAKLLLQNANVLLLDEPTNHLDIPSREVLEEALQEYPATILVISHDRYFLDKLANKVLVFEDDTAHLHEGNYTQYEATKIAEKEEKLKRKRDEKQAEKIQNTQPKKPKKRKKQAQRAYYV
ncbi:MAG: ABC-F family ATP-binding cassette domain-containing protein [Candidatus Poribacteria bacterium]